MRRISLEPGAVAMHPQQAFEAILDVAVLQRLQKIGVFETAQRNAFAKVSVISSMLDPRRTVLEQSQIGLKLAVLLIGPFAEALPAADERLMRDLQHLAV